MDNGKLIVAKSPVLELKNIQKSFSGIKVLNNVNLQLFEGEVHAVVGENGAGKSTLIKIISGAYQKDSGTFFYKGKEIPQSNPRWMLENGISTIYQEIDVVPDLTVSENILLGNEPLTRTGGINKAAMNRIAQKALNEIGAAEIDINATIATLKIAHQQMIAIAKSLLLNSNVLILDEPTAVFTSTEVKMLFGIIETLKQKGLAIIYISHHLDEIFKIGDRVTVLKDGQLAAGGTIDEFDHDSIVRHMVGRDVDLSKRGESVELGDTVLEVRSISSPGVYEGISFSVHQGEVLGIGGLVGSGRTEIARSIMGIDPIRTGEVLLYGKQRTIKSPKHALSLGMGILPENRKEDGLILRRSVIENAMYTSVVKYSNKGIVPWRKLRHKARKIVQSLNVKYPHLDAEIRFLSGGNQQKVVLTKLLGADCEIIVLDEPTRGVDVGARSEIYAVIQKLKAEGKAILMISSDLIELLSQSDRILVMSKGRIAGELDHREATEEKVLSLALNVGEEAA